MPAYETYNSPMSAEHCQIYGRRLSILIHRGLFHHAKLALEEAEHEYHSATTQKVSMDTPLAACGFNRKRLNILESGGFSRVSDLFAPHACATLLATPLCAWQTADTVLSEVGRIPHEHMKAEEWHTLVLQQRYRLAKEANSMSRLEEKIKQSAPIQETGWYVWRDAYDDDSWTLGYLSPAADDEHEVAHMRRILWLTTSDLKLMLDDKDAKVLEDAMGPFQVSFFMKIN